MGRLQLWAIVAAVAVLCIVAAAWAWQRSVIAAERARVTTEDAHEFRNTTERIGDADVGKGDADDDLRWLDGRLRAREDQR